GVSEFSRRAAERPDEESDVWRVASDEGRERKAEMGIQGVEIGARLRFSKLHAPRRSAAEIGSVHHTFLEFVSFENVGSVEELQAEAKRLEELGVLTPEQITQLDFRGLAAFWASRL